ncbi:MAG: hypothetical protein HQM01_05910 [Magnetococcales bacterium]|nr:hypothetical protein [Magnetococcales bacterium]
MTAPSRIVRQLLTPFFALLLLGTASSGHAEACRIGFDVGSSGIRMGPAKHPEKARIAIDYLGDVWPDHEINITVEPTIQAFRELPGKGGAPEGCLPVAGGYSAWRFALQKGDPALLVETLKKIHAQTGVPLFVIPQDVEGTHGHLAARQSLGEKLTTPFILDLGGGSVQIAGEQSGWGSDLGQKAWRKLFCEQVKKNKDPACSPNPVGDKAIEETLRLLQPRFEDAVKAVGTELNITAISAPVVKTLHPVLKYLADERQAIPSGGVDDRGFDRATLLDAIGLLQEMDDTGLNRLLNDPLTHPGQPVCDVKYLATLVTDMLLIHAIMENLEIQRMEVAFASITNVPGLIADPRAEAWRARYPCYLEKLLLLGVDAYKADPASCPLLPVPETGAPAR